MTAPWLQVDVAARRPWAHHGHRGSQVAFRHHQVMGVHMGEPTDAEPSAEPANEHALHCTLFAADIVGFGRRNDQMQFRVRKAMYRILYNAFQESGIARQPCFQQDRGDGVIIAVPPTVPTALLVSPLIDLVRAGLRDHNEMASEAAQVRLRTAVHAGSVLFDERGVIGHSIGRLVDLLDADAFKDELAGSTADLGLIASDYVYDDVIRHCSGRIDPDSYHPVDVVDGTTSTRGWVHLPGEPARPATGRVTRMRPAPTPVTGLPDLSRAAR